MSSPKKQAKKQKLERKRQQEIEARRKREAKRGRTAPPAPPAPPVPPAPRFTVSGFVDAPPEGAKMSEVLLDFIDPLVDSDDEEDYRSLLTMAVLAWNASLEPEPRRTEMIEDVLEHGFPDQPEKVLADARKIVELLVARKLQSFAHFRRPILDFVLEDRGGGKAHLSVISALV